MPNMTYLEQKMHGFPAKRPICDIVPISRVPSVQKIWHALLHTESRFQNLVLTGVFFVGVMRADPSWCLLDLDARRRSVCFGFDSDATNNAGIYRSSWMRTAKVLL